MHKHAQKMWKIGGAFGRWNYSSTDEAIVAQPESFNLVNPPYRDTFITKFEGTAWIVLRYQAVNPGPWMFHCHIEPHMAGGMSTAILDGIDAWPEVPEEYQPDAKGFRLEDGSPHGFAWEMRNTIESGSCAGDELFKGRKGGNETALRRLVEKLMSFLQDVLPESTSTAGKSST